MSVPSCRILHVLPSLDQRYGGPLRLVLDLSARALPLGLDSYVLGFGEPNLSDNPFPASRIHALPVAFPQSYCYSPSLASWLRENLSGFDGVVIHGAWLYPAWAAAHWCRRRGVPYACFPHGMLEPWAVNGQGWLKAMKKRVYWRWREHKIYAGARRAFFTTHTERRLASGLFQFECPQEVLTPYGIETDVPAAPQPARPDLVQPPERRIALFLGRVHPKKNAHFLLRAWAAAKVPPPWRLLIAGPGEEAYLSHLRHLAADLGIAEQVVFTGFVAGQDKAYLLQRADWFLLPSQQENFGVAVFEALSHNCPVAISDRVYLAETFPPGSEVLPLEFDAWVEFLKSRMADADWRNEVLRRDREHLLAHFSMEAVTVQWLDAMRRVFCP